MRPIIQRNSLWAYPLFGGIGASFGYWLQGVEERQLRILQETKESLLEKRRRRAEREGGINIGTDIAIGILPLPVLKRLELPKRQKIALMIVFGLGGWYIHLPSSVLVLANVM